MIESYGEGKRIELDDHDESMDGGQIGGQFVVDGVDEEVFHDDQICQHDGKKLKQQEKDRQFE